MTIYSIIPEHMIFEDMEQYEPKYSSLSMNGVELQVEWVNSQQVRVIRLFSVNPSDYMNPSYQPGTVINLQAVFPQG